MAISKTSIHALTLKSASAVRKLLKDRGVTVPDVDGGHESDAPLRGLQELQAIQGALEASVSPSPGTPDTGKK